MSKHGGPSEILEALSKIDRECELWTEVCELDNNFANVFHLKIAIQVINRSEVKKVNDIITELFKPKIKPI